MQMLKVDQIVEKYPEFDGILFYGVPDQKYGEVWKLSYLEFANAEFEKTENGYKHYIVFLLKDGGIEFTEATLSSPSTYAKNLLSGDQEAMIMKKCMESERLIKTFMYNRMISIMTNYNSIKSITEKLEEIEKLIRKENVVNV